MWIIIPNLEHYLSSQASAASTSACEGGAKPFATLNSTVMRKRSSARIWRQVILTLRRFGMTLKLSDKRSGLFFELMRIVRLARPQIVFLENVPAITVRGLDAVLRELAESGYDARWDCISSIAYGSHFVGDRFRCFATNTTTNNKGWLRGGEVSEKERLGRWSREQFERLLRVQTQLAIPAGRYGRLSDGIPFRLHRLRCLGNAVVSQCCKTAFELLTNEPTTPNKPAR